MELDKSLIFLIAFAGALFPFIVLIAIDEYLDTNRLRPMGISHNREETRQEWNREEDQSRKKWAAAILVGCGAILNYFGYQEIAALLFGIGTAISLVGMR